MKRSDLKENSSVFFIGKGIIIIAILITSSLSFALGYFVGRSVQPPLVNQTSVIPQQDSAEQKNAEPDKKETIAQQPEQTLKPQETQQTIKLQQVLQNQQTRKNQQTQQIRETKQTRETPKTTKTRKYTVQAGAFKDASDANALKTKLDKKGYKTFVTQSKTKKHKKLYKVIVGDFVTRKEAEVLSIKIKKAEGLKTFVTFKTE